MAVEPPSTAQTTLVMPDVWTIRVWSEPLLLDQSHAQREELAKAFLGTLGYMNAVFAEHDGSSACPVCGAVADMRTTLDHNFDHSRLRHSLKEASRSEKQTILQHHRPPPTPWAHPDAQICRVDLLLEAYGNWVALRLQEFEREPQKNGPRSLHWSDTGGLLPFPASTGPDLTLSTLKRMFDKSNTEARLARNSQFSEAARGKTNVPLWVTRSTSQISFQYKKLERRVCYWRLKKYLESGANNGSKAMRLYNSFNPHLGPPLEPSLDPPQFATLQHRTPQQAVKAAFRQHPKDTCVFMLHAEQNKILDELDPKQIKAWLDHCRDNHTNCSHPDSNPYPSNLILIDVQEMKLFEVPADTRHPYLALSYVWGTRPQPTLTQSSRTNWQADRGLENVGIPQTILDAMRLARMIDYRYLWVDALCIIQDDSSTRHHQIAQMYEIYRHADMTLIAADGLHCDTGLAGVSARASRAEKHHTYNLAGLRLRKLPASTRYSLEASHWRSRGWTFQEELCSRRALIFLPDLVLFSCASAVWREDVDFGDDPSIWSERADGDGLLPLASMLYEGVIDQRDAGTLFQGLVKQYMQRELSRSDDMENAFAGVARMFEPLLGPVYHGIPENNFDEIMHGCWFWDTSLNRRKGFPSWSWTGWVYRPEQADVGIQALTEDGRILQFYKFSREGLQALGQPLPPRDSLEEDLLDLPEHFTPNQDELQAKYAALHNIKDQIVPGHLVAFTTSLATLKLRMRPGEFGSGAPREYRAVHPTAGTELTSIRLDAEFVQQNGLLHPFIVIAFNSSRRAFRLMLISRKGAIAERVNVTAQSRLVDWQDWLLLGPQREVVVMA